MLAIRMQRTGRSGHAQYRVIVQDSRFSPTSGRVVAYLGSYNPHTKETTLDGEKAASYLKNGAQPSSRVVRLLKNQGVKLPDWVVEPVKKQGQVRNAEKLRKNRPAEEPAAEAPAEEVPETAEAPAETPATTPTEAPAETPSEQTSEAETEEPAAEAPAEEVVEEPTEPAQTPETTPESTTEPASEDK
jgi:small subunit ribosomal protein S16